MSLVYRRDEGGVATLTLNRPEKRNALTPELFVELRQHAESIAAESSVRCVVLAGAGPSFSAGHDLGAIASGERAQSRHFEPETIDLIEELPQPTVAKIRGYCLTGGLELALACDLMIAGRESTLGDTHGQWGLVPVWGMSVRLAERVGKARAKELMFTSRRIGAEEALRIGLVDQVIPDSDLDSYTQRLTSEICANSDGTNRIVKSLLRAECGMSRQGALAFERSAPFGRPSDMAERLTRPK